MRCVPWASCANLANRSTCSGDLLMPTINQPKDAKEKVREYMERRNAERRVNDRTPLHGPEEIRKEIGWDQVERRKNDRRER